MMRYIRKIPAIILIIAFCLSLAPISQVLAATDQDSVGIEGKISSPPPSKAPTISFPRNGLTTTDTPVTVTGLCTNDLTVKIFKNNVFAGSAICKNGSYSIQIDLFAGRNELVARLYDDLNQAGPDSNKVIVTFPTPGAVAADRVSLTSTYAKKGADPGKTLTWPIIISGGSGPYAITVDWGDGKTPDVISQEFAGEFNITHVYDSPGTYTIVVRATDKNKTVAFLQLIGVANGQVTGNAGNKDNVQGAATTGRTKIVWQPILLTIPLLATSFWLGKKHELQVLRRRLEKR